MPRYIIQDDSSLAPYAVSDKTIDAPKQKKAPAGLIEKLKKTLKK